MRKLGIIGGLGPETTVEYYRWIIADHRERAAGASPSLVIESLDVDVGLGFLRNNQPDQLVDYLLEAVHSLHRAGAGAALMAANTPHIVFDRLAVASPIPLISIVETALRAVQRAGLTRVALMGTRFTMEAPFFPEVFQRAGIEIVVPRETERDYIHDKYMNELLKNVFGDDVRARILSIAQRMVREDGVQGLVLGGTEIVLLFRDSSVFGVPAFDTARLHANAAVAWLLGT